MIHYFSGRLRVEQKGPSTGKLISKWENVVLRVGARNGQEGRKPGGNETWLEANGTGLEAEEEEGVKGKGVEDRKRTRRADCVSDQPCACPVPSRADGLHSGVFPHPLYILGVWEGPA